VSALQKRTDAVNIVVVTGMSGSGKTTATNALEDDGFYCIDNLPTELVPQFVELCRRSRSGMKKVALGLDLRDLTYAKQWPQVRSQLESAGHHVTVVFLEASDDVLIRRYSETRRTHPLGPGRSLPEAISEERRMLGPLRETADIIVGTSDYSVHDLKHRIHDVVSDRTSDDRLVVTVHSFGFKYGTVSDADLVFDVRLLPNPYFVEGMREKTGLDPDVAGYVLDRDDARGFIDRLTSLLDFLLPRYVDEGRSYLTIAIGCTGGRHRSIAIAERVTAHLAAHGHSVIARHRDVDRQQR
jgi:UPF0042 nucleotide-binding protein